MGRKMLTYSAGLIALYIVVYQASNAGHLLGVSSNSANSLVKTFQGR